jgi:ribosome-associated protein
MATKKKAATAKKSPAKKFAPAKSSAAKSSARKPSARKSFAGKPAGKSAAGRPSARKISTERGPAAKKRKGRLPKPAVPGTGRRPVAKRAASGTPVSGASALAAAPARAEAPDPARPTALLIAQAGLDKKAEEVTVLDVRGLTSYADYFVVMTADSDRQAGAIADHVEQTMKEKGVSKVGVEGYEGGRWILVDYGDVVAHVMNRESRGFYDLEGLWADAPKFNVED